MSSDADFEWTALFRESVVWNTVFVDLETVHGGQVRYLMPDEEPEAIFHNCTDKPVAVYAYCNIHGLWKTDIADACTTKRCCR